MIPIREIAFTFGLLAALVVAISGVACSLIFGMEIKSCSELRDLAGVETKTSFALGCMVKYQGQWVRHEVMTSHKLDVTVK